MGVFEPFLAFLAVLEPALPGAVLLRGVLEELFLEPEAFDLDLDLGWGVACLVSLELVSGLSCC